MSKKFSIEKSILRMEEILEKLENNELELETALELFEEGIKISKKCHNRLDKLEERVQLLSKDSNGRVIETDMKEA